MRRPHRPALLAAFALLLLAAGCTDYVAARQARLRQLVGQKLTVLIATEGVPDRSFDHAGVTYLAYVRQRVELPPSMPYFGPPWGPSLGGPSLGWYNAPPAVAFVRGCETVFAVKADIVRGFTMHGNDCG